MHTHFVIYHFVKNKSRNILKNFKEELICKLAFDQEEEKLKDVCRFKMSRTNIFKHINKHYAFTYLMKHKYILLAFHISKAEKHIHQH